MVNINITESFVEVRYFRGYNNKVTIKQVAILDGTRLTHIIINANCERAYAAGHYKIIQNGLNLGREENLENVIMNAIGGPSRTVYVDTVAKARILLDLVRGVADIRIIQDHFWFDPEKLSGAAKSMDEIGAVARVRQLAYCALEVLE